MSTSLRFGSTASTPQMAAMASVAERQLTARQSPTPDSQQSAPKLTAECCGNRFAWPEAGMEFRAKRCAFGALIESCPASSTGHILASGQMPGRLMMSPFYIVLSAVMVLTLFSAATAGILLVLGAGRTQAQKSVIDKLIRITLLGAERYAFRGLRHAERIKATLTAMLVTGAATVALVLISRFRHLQRCGSSASHR